jgi:RES domain-containing protein
VHIDKSEIPDDYVALGIEVGRGQIHPLSVKAARRVAGLASGQSSIEAFQEEFYQHSVLRVPSVIIPREYNYVLFPETANFEARILWVEDFRFDPRLL